MKTEELIKFEYHNAATHYYVRATEYSEGTSGREPFCYVTTLDSEESETVKLATRTEAVQLAESKIKGFLARMHIIYNAD